MSVPTSPRRRASDHHVHPEYWTESDQHRFEDRVSAELRAIRSDLRGTNIEVRQLTLRLTLMLGAIAIIGFLLPIFAPVVTDVLR